MIGQVLTMLYGRCWNLFWVLLIQLDFCCVPVEREVSVDLGYLKTYICEPS